MPKYVGAIDQGTTSSRFILFDAAGSVVACAQKEHAQLCPKPAWVEHNAEEIWQRVCDCVSQALASVGAGPSDIASIGITNQRETVIVWDKATGAPLYNALVWQDQRGAPLCDALATDASGALDRDRFKAKTGLPLVPYFSASKLRWLLDNVPGLRAAAEAGTALAGTIDSFLVWRLTGGALHVTDVSNASRTLLCNIHTLAWDAELCAAFEVPAAMLPSIVPSSAVYGVCSGRWAPAGLTGVPIGGILGDQQAALFGQTCFAPGDAKNTYGTGCFLLMNTGTTPVASRHGLLTTVAYQLGGGAPAVYALEGSVAVAGSVVQWLRDNLGVIGSAKEIEALAASVPDSGGVVCVPAFNGLFAPRWRSDARGLVVGLSGHTSRAHLARAALDSVAFQSKELLDAMAADAAAAAAATSDGAVAPAAPPALRVDGGMTANNLLLQFQADVTGRTVVKPVVAETTALGAAYAAGLAVGFWGSLDELRTQWKAEKSWTPALSSEEASKLTHGWSEAVARCLGWAPVADQMLMVPSQVTLAAPPAAPAAPAPAAPPAPAARCPASGAVGSAGSCPFASGKKAASSCASSYHCNSSSSGCSSKSSGCPFTALCCALRCPPIAAAVGVVAGLALGAAIAHTPSLSSWLKGASGCPAKK